METKLCSKCYERQPLDQFYPSTGGYADGLHPWCKTCCHDYYVSKKPPKPPKDMTQRRCSKCETVKPIEAFSKRGNRYRSWCKACIAAKYENNKEQIQAQHADYREKNPEKVKASKQKYYRENYDKIAPKQKDITNRRRARIAGAEVVEKVEIQKLYERDKGICQLCYKRCPRSEASIDHIVPICEGGQHSYRNTHLSHIRCNLKKNRRAVGEQLRLLD